MNTLATPERAPGGTPERDDRPRASSRSLFDPTIVRGALIDSVRKLHPRTQARNPVMFVVLVGSVLTTILFLRDVGDSTAAENVFSRARRPVPLVHRAVRQLRRGDGRGTGEGAGRDAAQDAGRDHGQPPHRRRRCRAGGVVDAGQGRRRRGVRGRDDPLRRRDHRGHRLGRRVGDHRRVRARDPRVGR